ncbi:MAG: ATP-binding protein [Pacificimonas sp.]|jgi:serine/threonine-protein kinase RsbT|nr:ATP-binding protein [Pacificimonas sp.]
MTFEGCRKAASVDLRTDRDVAMARGVVAKVMKGEGANTLMQTRFVTAVSEIARNAVKHGGGGRLDVFLLPRDRSVGVECRDRGTGIANLPEAMTDGFSTGDSMGRGLGGAQRLTSTFEIENAPGGGTVVRMTGKLQRR